LSKNKFQEKKGLGWGGLGRPEGNLGGADALLNANIYVFRGDGSVSTLTPWIEFLPVKLLL
jgi:hypothetical protein